MPATESCSITNRRMRGETFVTRKITRGLARIHMGLEPCLYLGNLDARRDWGHAKDYVLAQWLMLQQDTAKDYVVASGEQHSVREFVELAGAQLGMRIQWSGEGVDERGVDAKTRTHGGAHRSALFPPGRGRDVAGRSHTRRNGARLATHASSFAELVREMTQHDLRLAERDALMQVRGYRTANHTRMNDSPGRSRGTTSFTLPVIAGSRARLSIAR